MYSISSVFFLLFWAAIRVSVPDTKSAQYYFQSHFIRSFSHISFVPCDVALFSLVELTGPSNRTPYWINFHTEMDRVKF